MSAALQVLCLAAAFTGCSASQSPMHYNPQAARSNIVAALPTGWSAISSSGEQQRFTTEWFPHTRTESFILLGPQPNYIDWTDRQGQPHRKYLAKECLYVWIVPGDFRPALPSFYEDALRPDRIFVSRDVRVYGFVSHHIANTNRMDQILKAATRVSSGNMQLSWAMWKNDINASLSR
jgi:hypothetical protein